MAREQRILTRLEIDGYRPFREFVAEFGPLEVIAGANGSGKSALFEFLRFLRDGMEGEIPPEIVKGTAGQELFHYGTRDTFSWRVATGHASEPDHWTGSVDGPVGRPSVASEEASLIEWRDYARETVQQTGFQEYTRRNHEVTIRDRDQAVAGVPATVVPVDPDRLGLSAIGSRRHYLLAGLRRWIASWRFYSAFALNRRDLIGPTLIEQAPVLREDGGNLSAVLFHLQTEHDDAFRQLHGALRSVVPGYQSLRVVARGGPGQVMTLWREQGATRELSLADLSDGTLRLLCWIALAVAPNSPPLICLDEPDQGVHPRTLPVLAALFDQASERSQFLIATHASYFLTQFRLDQVAVMRKRDGRSEWLKPSDSAGLRDVIDEFGADEIEAMHRGDALEAWL